MDTLSQNYPTEMAKFTLPFLKQALLDRERDENARQALLLLAGAVSDGLMLVMAESKEFISSVLPAILQEYSSPKVTS